MDVSLKKSDLLPFEGKEYLVEGGWLGLLYFSRIAKYLILKYKKNEKIVHKKISISTTILKIAVTYSLRKTG